MGSGLTIPSRPNVDLPFKDDLGVQVADLNDTLHVSAMDTSFSVTLVFQRFSSTGKEARTVYHFDVPVYETNALSPSDKDNYYIQEASGNRYLRNTDGQFMTYSEDTDEEYLWRIVVFLLLMVRVTCSSAVPTADSIYQKMGV